MFLDALASAFPQSSYTQSECLEFTRETDAFQKLSKRGQGILGRVLGGESGISKRHFSTSQPAAMFDAGEKAGAEANMAKLLASEASWAAGDTCIQTHGGYGFATEYDIERKFRETRLYQVAPISTNLILSHVATHVLGLPKSF